MVYVVNGVLASGVDMVLEKDFVCFALQEMIIHPLMFLIRILSMILQIFSPTLHNQVANVSTHTPEPSRRFNIIYDYDDDDDDYEVSTIYLNDITSQIPSSIAITPVLPIKDSKNSLSMGDEHLSTIPEKESNEVIKSSVEDLEKSVTFSNPLFDSNDDFTFSDDESLYDEDVPEDNVRIYLNPLFEFDDEYISSDVNPLFNKGGRVDEIKLLLHRDPSTPKISVAFILEGFTDEPPLEENDDLFDLESKDNEWKKILFEAPIDDLMTEDKVFDLEILEKFFSSTYVSLPFEDRHYFSLTYVIRIFLPYFTYPMDSSLPLSSGSEDTIFDPGILVFSLEPVVSHRSGTFMCFNVYLNILNESPIDIFSSTLSVPNITMIWGESS
ncbi:hypothetical protein Tco_0825187 [Tanacetum coccineum]